MKSSAIFLSIFFAVFLTACNTTDIKPSANDPGAKADTELQIFEVFSDNRIYVFYNYDLYKEFLSVNETPYRLTKIGAGTNGMTLVYGLTKEDKKLKATIPEIELYEGKNINTESFYGEMRRHGRIYVFDQWSDMKPVRETGHPVFFYTEIGSGPKGETVVYVLNSKNKKHRPDSLMTQFKNKHIKR